MSGRYGHEKSPSKKISTKKVHKDKYAKSDDKSSNTEEVPSEPETNPPASPHRRIRRREGHA